MVSKSKQIFVLVVAIGLVIPQLLLGEDKKEAKRHFDNGTEMMELEDFAGAAVEFEASIKLYRSKNAVFNLAMCYKAMHKYPQALEMFRALLKDFSDELSPEVKEEVRNNIRSMNKMISKVEITTSVPGATILLDGENIGTSPLPTPVLVGAGEHRIRVSLQGHHDQETPITVVSGKDQVVEFSLEPIVEEAPAAAVPQTVAAPGAAGELPEDQVKVEQALGRSLARDYRYFSRSHLNQEMSFAAYQYKLARKKQIGGIIHLAVIAPIVQGVGLGLYFLIMSTLKDETTSVGLVNATVKEENNAKRGLAGALLGTCTIGTVVTIIVGSVKLARGSKSMRRLRPLLNEEKKTASTGLNFSGLSPLADQSFMPAGLSLNFTF